MLVTLSGEMGGIITLEPYLFQGTVLPERAQLSLEFTIGFSHLASCVQGQAKVSIMLNQVAVWVATDHEWDIFDLRNLVKDIVQDLLAAVGYLRGFSYDLEITRVISQSREINCVFGIDIPCLADRRKSIDLNDALVKLMDKTVGPHGIFLRRCFGDLTSAMKNANDTAFYCYRAIESLRHHCAALHNLSGTEKAAQWQRFREVAGCDEKTLRSIKVAADPLRHGASSAVDASDRAGLFTSTWDVVDGYLGGLDATSRLATRETSKPAGKEEDTSPCQHAPAPSSCAGFAITGPSG